MMQHKKLKDTPILPVTILLASSLTFFAYYPILDFYFELEDWGVLERLAARQPGLFSFWSPQWENYFRPIEWMFYYTNYSLFGMNPAPYNVVSISHQILNSILVYLLVRALRGEVLLAATSAVVFAVYPTVWEAVSWIVAAGHQIVASNILLTATCAAWYFRTRKTIFYTGMIFFFVLSLCTREQSIMTLPTIVLVHLYFLERPIQWKKEIRPYYALLPLFALYGLYQFQLQQANKLVSDGRYGLGIESISHWISLNFNIFVPNKIVKTILPADIAVIARENLFVIAVIGFIALALLATALAYTRYGRKSLGALVRSRFLYFSLALMSLHLFVYSLFIHGPGASSRYTYLGSIGASMVIAKLFTVLFTTSKSIRPKGVVILLFALFLTTSIANIRLGIETFHQRTNAVETALTAFSHVQAPTGAPVIYNFVNPPYVDYAWHRAVSVRYSIPRANLISEPIPVSGKNVVNLYFDPDKQEFFPCENTGNKTAASCGT